MTHRGPFQPLLFCDSVITLSYIFLFKVYKYVETCDLVTLAVYAAYVYHTQSATDVLKLHLSSIRFQKHFGKNQEIHPSSVSK